jgi:beta-lactam-binding protein with PASTA domain
MNAGALVMLYVAGPTAAAASVTVPDVTGMPVTEANRLLKSYGLELQVEGSGLAVDQSPAAGTKVNPTTRIAVRFEPP